MSVFRVRVYDVDLGLLEVLFEHPLSEPNETTEMWFGEETDDELRYANAFADGFAGAINYLIETGHIPAIASDRDEAQAGHLEVDLFDDELD